MARAFIGSKSQSVVYIAVFWDMGLEEHSDAPLAKSFMTDMVQAVKDAKGFLETAQHRQKKYHDLKLKEKVR